MFTPVHLTILHTTFSHLFTLLSYTDCTFTPLYFAVLHRLCNTFIPVHLTPTQTVHIHTCSPCCPTHTTPCSHLFTWLSYTHYTFTRVHLAVLHRLCNTFIPVLPHCPTQIVYVHTCSPHCPTQTVYVHTCSPCYPTQTVQDIHPCSPSLSYTYCTSSHLFTLLSHTNCNTLIPYP